MKYYVVLLDNTKHFIDIAMFNNLSKMSGREYTEMYFTSIGVKYIGFEYYETLH